MKRSLFVLIAVIGSAGLLQAAPLTLTRLDEAIDQATVAVRAAAYGWTSTYNYYGANGSGGTNGNRPLAINIWQNGYLVAADYNGGYKQTYVFDPSVRGVPGLVDSIAGGNNAGQGYLATHSGLTGSADWYDGSVAGGVRSNFYDTPFYAATYNPVDNAFFGLSYGYYGSLSYNAIKEVQIRDASDAAVDYSQYAAVVTRTSTTGLGVTSDSSYPGELAFWGKDGGGSIQMLMCGATGDASASYTPHMTALGAILLGSAAWPASGATAPASRTGTLIKQDLVSSAAREALVPDVDNDYIYAIEKGPGNLLYILTATDTDAGHLPSTNNRVFLSAVSLSSAWDNTLTATQEDINADPGKMYLELTFDYDPTNFPGVGLHSPSWGGLAFSLDGSAMYVADRGVNSEIWTFQVPEPATMALLALGGLAVLRRRRR